MPVLLNIHHYPSACPLYSLEFILNAIAPLVFNIWTVFSLPPSLCLNFFQNTVADIHSCRSPHEGFAALQFMLFSARPVRKACSQEKKIFSPLQDLYLYTRKNPYSYACTTNILDILIDKQHY